MMELNTLFTMKNWAIQFYNFLPRLAIGVIVLVVGLVMGKVAYKIVTKSLAKIGLDKAAKATGLTDIAKQVRIKSRFSEVFGSLIKYTVYLVTLVIAFDIFGLSVIGSVLSAMVLYIPRLIGAVVILVFGFILSGFIANVIGRAVKGAGINEIAEDVGVKFGLAEMAESITRYFLYVAVVLVTLTTLQISTHLLTLMFTVLIGGLVATGCLVLVVSLKDIAPNIATGLYFESNRTFKKGQKIEFKDYRGVIKEVGLVYTVIETPKGSVKVPNAELIKEESCIKSVK